MKFRCEKDTLADAIGIASRAVSSRAGALPILSGLQCRTHDGTLSLVGTDLEITIRIAIPVDTEGEFTAIFPARLFSDIVRSLEQGAVSVEVTDEQATITAGRSSFNLRLLPADDFPRLPEVSGSAVKVDADALADAMRQVVPAASHDDSRPILTGVLLAATPEGLRLVATDSYRLAVRDLPGVSVLQEGQHVLVAAKGLVEVERVLEGGEIEVLLAERDVTFRVRNIEITTRLIEGEFPNYEQLIPSGYPNHLRVHRDVLSEAVKRVRLVGAGRDNAPMRLTMNPAGLELAVVAQDVGEGHETVDAKFEGTDLTIAFNPEYLLDGVQAANTTEVVIESIDPLKPATLRAVDNNDFLYLLMPMRIS